MKLVLLNGSSRADGNTNHLLKQIVSKLININTQIINIANKKIHYCLGCHTCEETRECVQVDGVNEIYDTFKDADIIGIACPSYWGDITGNLKTFIDRSTPYCNTINNETTFPKGKKSFSLAIRAGSAVDENKAVLNSINHYLGHLEIENIFNETFEKIRSKMDMETDVNDDKIKNIADRINTLNYVN